MNDFDRENLNFLLTASKEDMEDWHLHATADDYEYALQLIRQRHVELTMQELELLDNDIDELDESDLYESREVLSNYTLH